MRILHLFSNVKLTGPAEPALNLVAGLKRRGLDVIFACGQFYPEKRSSIEERAEERLGGGGGGLAGVACVAAGLIEGRVRQRTRAARRLPQRPQQEQDLGGTDADAELVAGHTLDVVGLIEDQEVEGGQDAGGPGGPLSLYLHTGDADAAYAAAVGAGAEVIEEIWDAWWGGRQFTVADPDGNWWTVFQPSEG